MGAVIQGKQSRDKLLCLAVYVSVCVYVYLLLRVAGVATTAADRRVREGEAASGSQEQDFQSQDEKDGRVGQDLAVVVPSRSL